MNSLPFNTASNILIPYPIPIVITINTVFMPTYLATFLALFNLNFLAINTIPIKIIAKNTVFANLEYFINLFPKLKKIKSSLPSNASEEEYFSLLTNSLTIGNTWSP